MEPYNKKQHPSFTCITMHNQWHPRLPIMIERIRKLKDKWGAHVTYQQYMCIWCSLNNIIEKWVDEQHLLKKDYLMYEHDLILFHIFVQNNHNTRPPIWAHLTHFTQECNLTKDLQTHHPTPNNSNSIRQGPSIRPRMLTHNNTHSRKNTMAMGKM